MKMIGTVKAVENAFSTTNTEYRIVRIGFHFPQGEISLQLTKHEARAYQLDREVEIEVALRKKSRKARA